MLQHKQSLRVTVSTVLPRAGADLTWKALFPASSGHGPLLRDRSVSLTVREPHHRGRDDTPAVPASPHGHPITPHHPSRRPAVNDGELSEWHEKVVTCSVCFFFFSLPQPTNNKAKQLFLSTKLHERSAVLLVSSDSCNKIKMRSS